MGAVPWLAMWHLCPCCHPPLVRRVTRACCRVAQPVLRPIWRAGTKKHTCTLQGSGRSEGEWVTLGAHEVGDLAAAVAHLRAAQPHAAIGLWGRSMGAVTALLYSQRDPSIAGVVRSPVLLLGLHARSGVHGERSLCGALRGRHRCTAVQPCSPWRSQRGCAIRKALLSQVMEGCVSGIAGLHQPSLRGWLDQTILFLLHPHCAHL